MAIKKMKRYADGDVVTDDMRSAAETEGAKDDGPDSVSTSSSSSAPTPATSASSPSFKTAFAAARSNGDKTFTWNGKLYGTQLASSSSAATPRKVGNAPGGSSTPSAVLKPNRTGQPGGSVPTRGAGTVMQQGRDTDLYGGTINDIKNLFKKDPSKKSFQEANDERIAKNYKKGGSVSSASSRADGIASKGKTRGKMC
jgi:hypothetical protein